jgi:hypothetical protein
MHDLTVETPAWDGSADGEGAIMDDRRSDHQGVDTGDGGFSMVASMLSLVAVALLVALLLSTTLHSDSSSSTGISNAPGVAQADAIQAQQALTSALSAASTVATTAGGYGNVTPSALSAAEPSVSFATGPTTTWTTVSVAVSAGGTGGFGAGPSGSVTLADRGADGTCWLVWKSGGATWYGAQTKAASCAAPAIAAAPAAGPVSSSAIGWQEGTFPTV